jgi:hypothetical protein
VIVIVAVSPVVFVLVCHLKLLDLEDALTGPDLSWSYL